MRNKLIFILPFLLLLFVTYSLHADDGYRLWQRYDKIEDAAKLNGYQQALTEVVFEGNSPTMLVAQKELKNGLSGLLGKEVPVSQRPTQAGALVAGTPANSPLINHCS